MKKLIRPARGKQFYSHLIEIKSLFVELHALDLKEEEKEHLIFLIESTIHHEILDAILSELSEKDKKIFLEHFVNDDHEKIWKHLKSNIANIEEKIKHTAALLKKELYKDIKDKK